MKLWMNRWAPRTRHTGALSTGFSARVPECAGKSRSVPLSADRRTDGGSDGGNVPRTLSCAPLRPAAGGRSSWKFLPEEARCLFLFFLTRSVLDSFVFLQWWKCETSHPGIMGWMWPERRRRRRRRWWWWRRVVTELTGEISPHFISHVPVDEAEIYWSAEARVKFICVVFTSLKLQLFLCWIIDQLYFCMCSMAAPLRAHM